MPLEDEEQIDDMTISLQMQQFLDEWHFRVLNANMATTWNRKQTLVAAMDLFEAHGLQITAEEKWELASGDEDDMVEALVGKMSPQLRRSFEHFALQLQLIISTATRVRAALEEADAKEVTRIVEEGDKGITQHILKNTVIMAASQVGDKRAVKNSWSRNMSKRVERLANLALNTKSAQDQLNRINSAIDQFGQSQISKSTTVLTTMLGKADTALQRTVLSGWYTWLMKHRTEKHIHEKCKKEIEDAEAKLMKLKAARLETVRKGLMSRANGMDQDFHREILRVWSREAAKANQEKSIKEKIDAQKELLGGMKQHQAEAAKQSMRRFAAGNDSALLRMVLQAWFQSTGELRHEKEAEQKRVDMEAKIKAMSAKSKGEASGVMDRMKKSSDTGLVSTAFTAWAEDFRDSKKARAFEEQIKNSDQKFKLMKSAQKGKAENVSKRAEELEKENLKMSIFMNWQGEVKRARVIRYYSQKMTSKKEQLEAVRQMFTNFANDLGAMNLDETKAGRSQHRSKHGGGGGGGAVQSGPDAS